MKASDWIYFASIAVLTFVSLQIIDDAQEKTRISQEEVSALKDYIVYLIDLSTGYER